MFRDKGVTVFPWTEFIVLCSALALFGAALGEIALRLGELRASNFADLACARRAIGQAIR
jgi:hypothetical protein